jgi:hypothetical protein
MQQNHTWLSQATQPEDCLTLYLLEGGEHVLFCLIYDVEPAPATDVIRGTQDHVVKIGNLGAKNYQEVSRGHDKVGKSGC